MKAFRSLAGMLAIALSLLCMAGSASASSASSARPAATRVPSADAGYSVTGEHLSEIETWVTLPRPWRFARYAGRIGVSLQLWTSTEVIDFLVSACTDATCKAGGPSAHHWYHEQFAVYDRPTHRLICSTAATGAQRCPATQGVSLRQFRSTTFRPGSTIDPVLAYPLPYNLITASVGPWFAYQVPSLPHYKPALNFTQARITAEFGTSPWATPDFRAPASRLRVMSFDRPAPPPYAAEVGNVNGKAAGFAGPWWRPHKLTTRPGRGYATASGLWDDGYGFTVYLR
jgi:hypothetical protein